jgi:quinolinate synthase
MDQDSETKDLAERIADLKRSRDGVILAHNYQLEEIQLIADYIGDSFALSRLASEVPQNLIIFCGVHFMAESAKILAPHKTVILPRIDAGCPLADTITAEDLRSLKALYPSLPVVAYINTNAEVKAEADACCTSSNALDVIRSFGGEQVIMIPDRNLAHWVSRSTQKSIVPWHGICSVHHRFRPEEILEIRRSHPEALVVVHPECRPSVVELADYVLGTGGMLQLAGQVQGKAMFLGTELGLIGRLKWEHPNGQYYSLGRARVCPNMKLTRLHDVGAALEGRRCPIEVPHPIAERARRALERMLACKHSNSFDNEYAHTEPQRGVTYQPRAAPWVGRSSNTRSDLKGRDIVRYIPCDPA